MNPKPNNMLTLSSPRELLTGTNDHRTGVSAIRFLPRNSCSNEMQWFNVLLLTVTRISSSISERIKQKNYAFTTPE